MCFNAVYILSVEVCSVLFARATVTYSAKWLRYLEIHTVIHDPNGIHCKYKETNFTERILSVKFKLAV